MAEKIKYIVKCTFCDKDYSVEIEDGEDFSCPTCGGAGKRENAVCVTESKESAEVEKLKDEIRKLKLNQLYGKKKSLSGVAKEEEKYDDFRFEQMDKYESSLQREDKIEEEPEVDAMGLPEISDETRAGWRSIFFVIVVILVLISACAGYEEKKEKKSIWEYSNDREWYWD